MYKIGLKLWSINENYFDDAIKLFDNEIYDFIELYAVPDSINTLDMWKKLNEYGIPFNIHAPHFAHGFNLAKEGCFESNLKMYQDVKVFADELNAEYIVFHGGIDGDINETARQLKIINDERALLENKPLKALPKIADKLCRGYNIEEVKTVLDTVNCGFCLDIGHCICSANAQGIEPYSYIEEFLKLSPKMFHLSDIDDMNSVYDTHSNLGKGELDFKKVLGFLPQNATITIETKKASKGNLDDFVQDMEFIKDAIENS